MRFKEYLEENSDIQPFLTDPKEIAEWLSARSIEPTKYTIDADGTVDVNCDVRIENVRMKRLPVRFGKVNGDFIITKCSLRTLEGCPEEVGDNFDCSYNMLTTLEFAPKVVGSDFSCRDNILTSLKGCPTIIKGDFNASQNALHTLKDAPIEVLDGFIVDDNDLTTLEFAPKRIGVRLSAARNFIQSLEGIADHIESIGFSVKSMSEINLYGAPNNIKSGGLGLMLFKGLNDFRVSWAKEHKNYTSDGTVKTPSDIIKKYLGKPDEIFDCQNELIEAGYEEIAKL